MTEPFTFGIEEEYFLVHADTREVACTVPRNFHDRAKAVLGGRVKSELLQAQIEVATEPHVDADGARRELRALRRGVAKLAAEHGLAIMASGTHPSASWEEQRHSPSERHDILMEDLQMLALRNMLCGLHVHVALPDPDERVALMTRMLPYLPLFIALSTSSPFWRARPTGLRGYRLAAYDELPRTGVPELFRTRSEFDAYVLALKKAGVIADASYIWWAMRPSLRHPTLELRAPDCCTRVEDSLAIASLYRSLARRLQRNPSLNEGIDAVGRAIVVENKWRAQRYGVHATFVNDGGAITVARWIEQLVDAALPDAEALGCPTELQHCVAIARDGTSADMQIAIYEARASDSAGLCAVREWIATTTLQ